MSRFKEIAQNTRPSFRMPDNLYSHYREWDEHHAAGTYPKAGLRKNGFPRQGFPDLKTSANDVEIQRDRKSTHPFLPHAP